MKRVEVAVRASALHTALFAGVLGAIGGCSASEQEASAPSIEVDDTIDIESKRGGHSHAPNGKKLFETETFGGNGRTCETCHSARTGTVSPDDARKRFAKDRSDPLFRAIDSDDGVGDSYARLLDDATIRVTIPLPPGWSLQDDPMATSVTFRRGIPTSLNVPSLDDIFMFEVINSSLE